MTERRSVEGALGRRLTVAESRYAATQLFGVGAWSLLQTPRRVAIVGASQATAAGLERATVLTESLTQLGVTIISGLEDGISAAVHARVHALGGGTIGVSDRPIDALTPRRCFATVAELGLVVSSIAAGAKSSSDDICRSHRVGAVLAGATVIVEARDGSRLLQHAWEAIRLGRPLFVLHDDPEAPQSRARRWWMEMIQHGAKVLRPDELGPVMWALDAGPQR